MTRARLAIFSAIALTLIVNWQANSSASPKAGSLQGIDQFAGIDPQMKSPPSPDTQTPAGPDPFADLPMAGPSPRSTIGTAFYQGLGSILPAAAGFPAGAAGAEAGELIGSLAGPIGTGIGGVIGGLVGFFGGTAATQVAQDYAVSKMPYSWQDALGQSEREKYLQETQHPDAVLVGHYLPYAAAFFLLIMRWCRRNVMTPQRAQKRTEGVPDSRSGVEKRQSPEPVLGKKFQITLTATILILSAYHAVDRTMNPKADDLQGRLDLYYHPIASILGSLLPTIIIAPLAYWVFGRISRRVAAHYATLYKVCEHCAETIKLQAKVCRFCGRDLTPTSIDTSLVSSKADSI